MSLVDLASWLLLGVGSVFCVLGGVGLLRFPDFYSRIHAAGVTDTMGAGLVLLGLMLQAGFTQVTLKLVFLLAFMLVTSPTAAHALVKAAYAQGIAFTPRQEPSDADAGRD